MAMIILQPLDFPPLHWAIIGFAVVLSLLSLLWVGRIVAQTRRFDRRILVALLTTLAIWCLALAALNPVDVQPPTSAKGAHLSVVLDVSDSVLRGQNGWDEIARLTREVLERGLNEIPADVMQLSTASIVTFRGGVADNFFPLGSLLNEFNHLNSGQNFASGDGTDLGLGLQRAGELIVQAGGRGEILLITDGNDTVGNALPIARQLAQRGIPISVLPVSSSNPELAITSANLANQTNAGMPTHLRGVIYNTGADPVSAVLDIYQNPGVTAQAAELIGPENRATVSYTDANILPAKSFHALRQAITFEGVGIQFVDLALAEALQGTQTHRRRFFIHVNRPLRLLMIGGDLDWKAAIAPGFASVTAVSVNDLLDGISLSQFDAVILSEVPATALSQDFMERVANQVELGTLGLFMVNGDHNGASEEVATILHTYQDTPIARLLPVATGPRPTPQDPPSRHVLILIDASGSMSGWPLDKAKAIARHVIETQLRPNDVLDLIAFNTSAVQIVNNEAMDTAAKQRALSGLNGLSASGGTDPQEALRLAKNALSLVLDQRMTNCGLFFISDGIFDRDVAQLRPGCRAAVFMVGSSVVPQNSPLRGLADPFGVDQSFDPTRIEIPFFKPEERNKFFENGLFTPFGMAGIGGVKTPNIPNLEINGAAISYPLEFADLSASRPRFADPVLVYGSGKLENVGVFTAGFTSDWITQPDGQEAIQDWLKWVVPYSARDRYTFDLTDDGDELRLQIELKARDGNIPEITHLATRIQLPDQEVIFSMQPVQGSPSTFEGRAVIPRQANAQAATLVLEEAGSGALPRPQRIPILIPMQSALDSVTLSEALSFGLNTPLLTRIAEMSGGQYDPDQNSAFFQQIINVQVVQPLWPYLVVASAILYWLAIAVGKVRIFE